MPARKLTPKQEQFVEEYLVDLNAAAAVRRAKYKVRRPEQQGYELLRKPDIAAAIAARRAKIADRLHVSQERVIREYARLAFRDVRRLLDDAGRLRPIGSLDDDDAAAIAGIEIVTVGSDRAAAGEVTKVKLADKQAALDSIARYLGMFERDNRQRMPALQINVQQLFADLLRAPRGPESP